MSTITIEPTSAKKELPAGGLYKVLRNGYWDVEFAGGEPAFKIDIFGKPEIPEGVSILKNDLVLREQNGGNNSWRYITIPKGTKVYWHYNGGMEAITFFVDQVGFEVVNPSTKKAYA